MLDFIEPQSIDSIVTDPPYGLTSITKRLGNKESAPIKDQKKNGCFDSIGRGFMGKEWDGSGIEYNIETWQKCYEVLKPGGYLLAFGGTRTFHRIACAIEDAGFEIRDTIMWLYGSGFPKSHNIGLDIDKLNGCSDRGHRIAVANRNHPDGTLEPNGDVLEPYQARTDQAKEWQGWGTALKPSYEPIIVARKPVEGTVAKNCLKYGVGGINIDECRVGTETITSLTKDLSATHGNNWGAGTPTPLTGEKVEHQGRFPANTILTYDDTDFEEVCGGFPNTKGNGNIRHNKNDGKNYNCYSNYGNCDTKGYDDSGSASRYFYCAKASKKDRDEGLEDFIPTTDKAKGNGLDRVCEFCGVSQLTPELCHCETKSWITKPKKNTHPTVKPTELMQYLIRLVTPKGGVILDPFNGSGSTGKAVMYENKERNKNYKYIGIELTEEYLPIAKARIEYLCNDVPKSDLTSKTGTLESTKDVQMSLFD